jgi:hypothetical protein
MRKFPDDGPITSQGIPLPSDPAYPPDRLHLLGAGIAYWAFDSSIPQLTLAHTTSHTAPEHSYDLHLVFTAWHNPTSQPIQVLAWTQRFWSPRIPKDFPQEHPIIFEFRCGPQSVQLETIVPLGVGANVCFADVTSDSASTIKLLHGGLLYLYEPAAGNLPALPNTSAWTTLTPGCDTTIHYDHTDPNASPVLSPRVRTLSLCMLATQFLVARKNPPELGDRQPRFHNIMHIFLPARKVRRTKPGVFTPHSKTLIAFGASEKMSGLFHLLVFTLQLPCRDKHPRVNVVVAKAFGTKEGFVEPDGSLTPERANMLFDVALKKCGVQGGLQSAWHDCENECSNDEIEVRKMYEYGAPGLEEIRCPNMGIVLEGWNGGTPDHERNPNEQTAARRLRDYQQLRRVVEEQVAQGGARMVAEAMSDCS